MLVMGCWPSAFRNPIFPKEETYSTFETITPVLDFPFLKIMLYLIG
jgi:hypothetical protein